MKSLKARDVSDDLMERKTYLVKDVNALIPKNLKVTVCFMHNNWRANRAWNKWASNRKQMDDKQRRNGLMISI